MPHLPRKTPDAVSFVSLNKNLTAICSDSSSIRQVPPTMQGGIICKALTCDLSIADENRYADAVQHNKQLKKKTVHIHNSLWRYSVPNIRRWWHTLIPAKVSAAKNARGVAVQHLDFEICSDGNRTDHAENLEKD